MKFVVHQYGADDKRVHQSTTLELIKPSMGYIYTERKRKRVTMK